jgi:hypothetical protein
MAKLYVCPKFSGGISPAKFEEYYFSELKSV